MVGCAWIDHRDRQTGIMQDRGCIQIIDPDRVHDDRLNPAALQVTDQLAMPCRGLLKLLPHGSLGAVDPGHTQGLSADVDSGK